MFETVSPAFATKIQNFATAMRNLTQVISIHLDVRAIQGEVTGLGEAGTADDPIHSGGG